MGFSNKQGNFLSAVPMVTSIDSESIDIPELGLGGCQVTWLGADQVDATVVLQVSLDNKVSWADIPLITYALNAAAGSKYLNLPDLGAHHIRAKYTKGTNTVGAVSVHYLFKSYK